ncbi:MAG: ABC transporter permease subunit [Oscillospiraceae bacterium]|jgi:putative aldouronate transport system permease protein|nr:ABC transporter permease subunit [Oscillospiraceae bacterium]
MDLNAARFKRAPLGVRLAKDWRLNRLAYIMALPVAAYFITFCYLPMYGVAIAFKKYSPIKGIMGSAWVGLKYFREFTGGYFFWRTIRNTFLLGVFDIVWAFPAAIAFALLVNEMKFARLKKTIQTITYLPYFVSSVVIAGVILAFCAPNGLAGIYFNLLGQTPRSFLGDARYFRSVYVISNIWQYMGFNSIIYLAALAGIDQELYDAAVIDGAGRWRRLLNISLPGIAPTIAILFIMRLGSTLNVGSEKILLIYNAGIYETSDVIATFTYRKGLLENNFGYSTAVGLLNSLVNFVILYAANALSRRVSEVSLW